MASSYEISVESDGQKNESYNLRISRDGRTWNAVKDQAQLDAFHARATRLGATNGVAFSTKPTELEAYLSDVARHARQKKTAVTVPRVARRKGRRLTFMSGGGGTSHKFISAG